MMSSSARSATSASDTYDNGLREQSNAMAQRDLIATVLDLKVDSRLEMQRMSQRIGRLEDLLTELVKRLSSSRESSDLSTPADETIPTITTTFVGSPPATSATAQPSNIYIASTASSSSVNVPPPPTPSASVSSIQAPSPSSSSGTCRHTHTHTFFLASLYFVYKYQSILPAGCFAVVISLSISLANHFLYRNGSWTTFITKTALEKSSCSSTTDTLPHRFQSGTSPTT